MAKRCPKMCNLCGKCKKNQQQQNNYGIKSKQFNTIKSYGKCLLQFNSIVVDPLHSSFHPLLLFFLFLLSFRCPHYLNVRNRLIKILGQSCDFSSRARSVCQRSLIPQKTVLSVQEILVITQTVRPSVRPRHRPTNVKCQTLQLCGSL